MADFRSDIANDIADVISTVADKAKKYGGYAKIQALIKAEEAKKQEQYYRLGKKYYELYKSAPASDLADITEKIAAMDARIEAYREELKAAEAEGYTDVVEDEDVAVEEAEDAQNADATEADFVEE